MYNSVISESEVATHSVLCLCSFQDFFKKAGAVSEAAGEADSASQQEPAVIVLLPLLLGLGKVRLGYNALCLQSTMDNQHVRAM